MRQNRLMTQSRYFRIILSLVAGRNFGYSCFLLRNIYDGEKTVLSYVRRGILQIVFSLSSEITAIENLMSKYKDVPMSLSDACLVRMSELIDNSVVFTLDSDFHIYRKNDKRKIDLIIPE